MSDSKREGKEKGETLPYSMFNKGLTNFCCWSVACYWKRLDKDRGRPAGHDVVYCKLSHMLLILESEIERVNKSTHLSFCSHFS